MSPAPALSLRGSLRLLHVIGHMLWVLAAVALAFIWLKPATRGRLKARWSRQLLGILGVGLRSQGTVPAGGLVVANHISWLDILAINAVAPASLVSKDDVRGWPLIGWLAARMDTLFIERGSRLAAQRTREHLVAALATGRRIGVFPEGTTGYGDQVLPFHGALFQSAIDAGVAVTPLLLRYTDAAGRPSTAAAYVGDTDLWQSLRAIIAASGLQVHLHFLGHIDTADTDRRHLAHHCHQVIAHTLAAVLGSFTPSHPVPPAAHTATETPADPPAAPPSDGRPTDNRNPAPTDSAHA